MKPRLTVVALAVDDLDTASGFDRDGPGFATAGAVVPESAGGAVVCVQLQHGPQLALWPRPGIAQHGGLAVDPASAPGMTPGTMRPHPHSSRSS